MKYFPSSWRAVEMGVINREAWRIIQPVDLEENKSRVLAQTRHWGVMWGRRTDWTHVAQYFHAWCPLWLSYFYLNLVCAGDLNEIINFKLHENPFGTSQPVACKKTRKELMMIFCNFWLRKSPKISSRLIYVTWFAIFYVFVCKICVFYQRV